MKFSIAKSTLNDSISCIQSIVPTKPVLPILSNFLLEATSDGLQLTATDMTVTIRHFLPMQVQEEGSTTLPSKQFFRLIRELTASDVEIRVNENNTCQLQALASQFKINGMPKSEFPALPSFEESLKITIKRKTLKEMLFKTAFAASKDENRYLITGILFKIEQGKLIIVGTDARRLAKMEENIDVDTEFSGQYIVPIKGVDEILKILDRSKDETVVVYFSADRIAVEMSSVLLTTKLLVGDFPDFKDVIPKDCKMEIQLHRDELTTLLRQISIFTQEDGGACQFAFTSGELQISSSHHQIGEGVVSMPVNFSNEPFSIAFKPQHILDVLRHSKQEVVTFKFIDAFNPMLMEDSSNALYVVMPMRRQ